MGHAFAVWLTGLPASGKSAIAQALARRLAGAGLSAEILESDSVRRILTPAATYGPEERALFYRALAWCGSLLVAHGVPVIFDATASRREYRDLARSLIPRFAEVAVICPLQVCEQRDRKGTYRAGRGGASRTVPGLQEPYEPPLLPDVIVDTTRTGPEDGADLTFAFLQRQGYLSTARDARDDRR
jgi:adenylylsulfate kinase